jgi:hypothetical protein
MQLSHHAQTACAVLLQPLHGESHFNGPLHNHNMDLEMCTSTIDLWDAEMLQQRY